MSFEILQADLFHNFCNFDALAQGVNCQGVMGAGIAVPFREKFPNMYEDYKRRCATYGDALAGLLHVYHPWYDAKMELAPNGDWEEVFNHDPTIYNLFSQVMPGRNGDYRLLQQAAIAMVLDAERNDIQNVGLPWIGCGIAGLEKHNVFTIFKQVFDPSPVHFVLVQKEPIHAEVTAEELAALSK